MSRKMLRKNLIRIILLSFLFSTIPPVSADPAPSPSILGGELWGALVESASASLPVNGKINIVFPKPASTLSISLNKNYSEKDVQDINIFAKEVSAVCPGFTPKIVANDSSAQIQINIVPKKDFQTYLPDENITGNSYFLWFYNAISSSMVSAKSVIDSEQSSSTRTFQLRAQLLYSLGFLGSTYRIFSEGNFTPLGRKVLLIYCSNLVKPGSLISDSSKEMDSLFLTGDGSKPSIKPKVNTNQISSGVISIEGDASKQITERVLGLEWSIQGGTKVIAQGYIDNSKNVVNETFEIYLDNLVPQLYSLTLRFKVASKREGLVTSEVFGDAHKSTFYYRTSAEKPQSKNLKLTVTKSGKKIILDGTAAEGEGDIIVYIKRVGTTKWVEQAATIRVVPPGAFSGLLSAPKSNVLIRVKQEGTGKFSNQIVVLK